MLSLNFASVTMLKPPYDPGHGVGIAVLKGTRRDVVAGQVVTVPELPIPPAAVVFVEHVGWPWNRRTNLVLEWPA